MPEGSGSGMAWKGHEAGMLGVELYYAGAPNLDERELAAEVRQALPQTVLAGEGSAWGAMLAHEGHMATIARDALARCDASLAVVETMGKPHLPADRLRVFRATVLAVARLTHPLLAWWPTATQALPPPTAADPDLMGLLNVRLFNVEGTDGDVVMDTLGLHAFGLPDLQCHCRGLEPTRLARLLMNAGSYVFEHGDVIDNGHTIEGLEPGQRWRCQHEDSLVAPKRVVVDLDPGPPHAAGKRQR